jgi:hypothetical protein
MVFVASLLIEDTDREGPGGPSLSVSLLAGHHWKYYSPRTRVPPPRPATAGSTFSTCFSFSQSCTVLLDTLVVHRKAMGSCISRRPRCDTYKSFAATLWNTSLLFLSSRTLPSETSKVSLLAGDAADLVMGSPNSTIASFKYSFILISAVPLS